MKFPEMTAPEIAQVHRDRTLVLAPIASCEQHSGHLPTFTDSILVGAVADAVEQALATSILLLPVQWLGASDHHLPFGGTLTASVDHHVDIVADIVASVLEDGFRRLLVLNGHGGNSDTMKMALRRLQPRYADRLVVAASYWDLCADRWAELARGPRKSMGHACEFETAMMMHLRPDLVRADRRADDHLDRSDRLRSLFWAEDFSQATIQGAVGFPTHATAESGREYLAAATERCVETCQELLSVQQPPGRVRKGWQV